MPILDEIEFFDQEIQKLPWAVKLCELDLTQIEWPTVPDIDSIASDDIKLGVRDYLQNTGDIAKLSKFRRLCWEFADVEQLDKVKFREMPQMIKLHEGWRFNQDFDIIYGCQRMNWAKVWGFLACDAIVHDIPDTLTGSPCKSAKEILSYYDEAIYPDMHLTLCEFFDVSWPCVLRHNDYASAGCADLRLAFTEDRVDLFDIQVESDLTAQEVAMVKLMVSEDFAETRGYGWRCVTKNSTSDRKKFFKFPNRLAIKYNI